ANDRRFAKLCTHLKLPTLPEDLRFSTNRARVENREALEVELCAAFQKTDGEKLGPALLADGVPAAPILDMEAVANSEHARFRNMVVRNSSYTGPGIPIKLVDTPASIRRSPPALGSTTLAANDVLFEVT